VVARQAGSLVRRMDAAESRNLREVDRSTCEAPGLMPGALAMSNRTPRYYMACFGRLLLLTVESMGNRRNRSRVVERLRRGHNIEQEIQSRRACKSATGYALVLFVWTLLVL